LGLSDSLSSTAGEVLRNNVNSWSRTFYLRNELTDRIGNNYNPRAPILLNSIAYKVVAPPTSGNPRTEIRIYMKCTTSVGNLNSYRDPIIEQATLVYQGPVDYSAFYPDWIELPFTESPYLFEVNPNQNLIVYVDEHSPVAPAAVTWRGETRAPLGGRTFYGTSERIHNGGLGNRARQKNAENIPLNWTVSYPLQVRLLMPDRIRRYKLLSTIEEKAIWIPVILTGRSMEYGNPLILTKEVVCHGI
jgi:hypothetical protein